MKKCVCVSVLKKEVINGLGTMESWVKLDGLVLGKGPAYVGWGTSIGHSCLASSQFLPFPPLLPTHIDNETSTSLAKKLP